MKDKGIGLGELQSGQGGLDLRPDRSLEVVDLIDHEELVAAAIPAADSLANDLFGIAILIHRGGIDQVETRVECPPNRRDTGVERELSVGHIPNAELRGDEAGPPQFPPGRELPLS